MVEVLMVHCLKCDAGCGFTVHENMMYRCWSVITRFLSVKARMPRSFRADTKRTMGASKDGRLALHILLK